ncbi:diacylglycerol kinase [Arenibacter certesii]|uniref:Diacylglycerol kinase n=1 Tax=Arenibacter certesii TaxID=228955 RepID=A0A918IM31_9FLAO|nr:diacylglycerol kinase family protein [Arenibacter certesii]GGW22553.1 diacylglycerol kinase [Arenibacter certesii]
MPKENFLTNRIRSIGFAAKGAILLIKTEASIKVQVFICLVMTVAGFYFEITNTEWCLQIMSIALVLGMEGMNTAIEKVADFVQPNFDPKIGLIKDISAGAVMLVSIAACIIGIIIYGPKLF